MGIVPYKPSIWGDPHFKKPHVVHILFLGSSPSHSPPLAWRDWSLALAAIQVVTAVAASTLVVFLGGDQNGETMGKSHRSGSLNMVKGYLWRIMKHPNRWKGKVLVK